MKRSMTFSAAPVGRPGERVGHDQTGHSFRAGSGSEHAHDTAEVMDDERGPVDTAVLEQPLDDRRVGRQIDVGRGPFAEPGTWEVDADAPKVRTKLCDYVAPDERPHPSVDEHQYRPGTFVGVVQ